MDAAAETSARTASADGTSPSRVLVLRVNVWNGIPELMPSGVEPRLAARIVRIFRTRRRPRRYIKLLSACARSAGYDHAALVYANIGGAGWRNRRQTLRWRMMDGLGNLAAFPAHCEPLPLDDAHPAIREIAAAACGQNTAPPPTPWLFRFASRNPTASLVAWWAWLAGVATHTVGLFRWSYPLFAIAAGITLFAWRPAPRGQWLLVPGGVLVRRPRWRTGASTIERHVPSDSFLILTAVPFAWKCELIPLDGKRHPASRGMTTIEAAALLAAWQSPLPAPRAEQLTDLH